jgi:CO/xanthine dehydrogenase Mo-binding subunit
LIRSAATAAGAFLSIGLPALGSSIAAAQPIAGFTPSIWFTLTPDGKVTMHIVKAEMGQHIGTALAQIIAEELEVKWEDVRLDSPLESVENFAIYGLAYTVNSGSVTTEFDRLSRAGAAGRTALIEAGAQVLGAKESDCLWRDRAESEDRSQVRIPGRLQGDQAQVIGRPQHHRQVDSGP